jgi:YVTN family beta-propeller protein
MKAGHARNSIHNLKNGEPEWVLFFTGGVRPFTFDTNADGSTKRIFVQLSGLHGFAVVDFARRMEVGRITLPDLPPAQRFAYNASVAGAHGIGVSPDGKAVWTTSTTNSSVYAYSLPDLKLKGGVGVGLIPDWLTFTPDSKFVYVANTGTNDVSVVDTQAMKEVTRIPVGQAPKRNITVVLPSTESAVTGASPAALTTAQALDFQFYRTRVERIFLKPREGNSFACVGCHTTVASRLRLQPLAPGATSWSEEQSHRNLEAVARLVAPGDPLKSRLLLHPLAVEAGGDPAHTGGKFWNSQDDPEWQTLAAWVRTASAAARAVSSVAAPVLDCEVFRTRVQPIFLNKRQDTARCYVCHARGAGGSGFGILPLSPGSASWTEEESRRNFEAVQRVVVPGDPLASRLLMKPLAAEAGGELTHHGGKHWTSQNDPEWQTLAAWVRGSSR